ncbi:pre translocase subunit, putative [Babesia ovis]|uniref:Pre translocase subunit, putative n=1 Tax=Babesia ovis TaxID=5869 RepID=A0A9W5TAS4_BABOV|nr:pre translocase subunit, putative [Babesia ovis]
MDQSNPVLTLDDVCRFYHPDATFPSRIRDLPVTNESEGLLRIGNLLDQQLSVGHLSRHEMILFVTNGPHGRNIIDYLYRERVFAPYRGGDVKTTGLYYVCPRRPGSSEQQYITNSRSWVPTGLSQADRHKITEAVKTIDVVTTEESMQTFSVFLMEIANQRYSSLGIKDTLLECLIQNRATRVVVLLDYRVAKSQDLMAHMETVLAVVESGHMDKIDLLISFDEDVGSDDKIEEIVADINEAFKMAYRGREYENELLSHSFIPFKVPTDASLVAHLLGGNEQVLAPFLKEIRNKTFQFDTTDGSEPTESGTHRHMAVSNIGVEALQSTLQKIKHDILTTAVDKLERDIDNLYEVSTRHLREDRNKEITNLIVSCHALLRHMQNCAVLVIITASVFIKLLSFVKLDADFESNGKRPVLKWICNLGNRYTLTQWIMFYISLAIAYVAIHLLGTMFRSIEKLDPETYGKHKMAMKQMESIKGRLKELKNAQKLFAKEEHTTAHRRH